MRIASCSALCSSLMFASPFLMFFYTLYASSHNPKIKAMVQAIRTSRLALAFLCQCLLAWRVRFMVASRGSDVSGVVFG